MAFVRDKVVNGKTYYQLVENRRVFGKHRQEVLCHLGKHPSVETAIEHTRQKAKLLNEELAILNEKIEHLRDEIIMSYPWDFPRGHIPTRDYAHSKKEELREEHTGLLSSSKEQRADLYWRKRRKELMEKEWHLANQILAYHSARDRYRKLQSAQRRLEAKLHTLREASYHEG